MKALVLLVLVTCVSQSLTERTRYDGYQLWEVTVSDSYHHRLLQNFQDTGLFEIINQPRAGQPGLVLVSPQTLVKTRASLMLSGIRAELHTVNIQEEIDETFARLDARYKEDPYSFDVNDYNTYDALMKQITVWKNQCPTGLTCTSYDIGKSYQGRPMTVLKVSKTGSKNPALWFESVIHAREWIAVTTVQNIANHLITKYPSDPEVKRMVDKYDFYLLLVANPDGYIYSWTTNRLWRKNLRPNPNSSCRGTDLNRNFDNRWGKQGANPNPCSETYPGPYAASEPETKLIQDEAKRLTGVQKVISWYAVHCCAKMWMFPHANTIDFVSGNPCQRTPDHADIMQVAKAAITAVMAKEGQTNWKAGTICDVIYPATGSEVDYLYDSHKVKYSWALELRGSWFVQPKTEIPPAFREFWAGVVASAKEIEKIDGL